MTCSKPNFKLYTGLVEQFEYCETCGTKKSEHDSSSSTEKSRPMQNHVSLALKALYATGSGLATSPSPASHSLPIGAPVSLPVQSFSRFYEHVKRVNYTASNNLPSSLHIPAVMSPFAQKHVFSIPQHRTQYWFAPAEWITEITRSNAVLYGVDRSLDPQRLAGSYLNNTGLTTEVGIDRLASSLHKDNGYHPTDCFLHTEDYQNLLSGKFITIPTPLPSTFKIPGPNGYITCHHDSNCIIGYGYLLDLSTWRNEDNFGIFCNQPGANGVVRFK